MRVKPRRAAVLIASAFLLPGLGLQPAAAQNATLSPADSTDEAVNLAREGLPLMPGRWMEMTAEEGSWISLDVSPDGRTVVFDLLGDLYTVPITGGKATALTQGMAFDGQPRFSPDGQRVVFVSDRSGGENLHIISLDRSDTVQLTTGKTSAYQSPEWTPDGDYIVATKNQPGAGKLWLYHAEGGSGVALIDEPAQLLTTGAAFGADDRYVWYAQRRGGWQYNSPMRDYQLAVYDRDTGASTSKSDRYGGAVRPTLSPDGRWLVYATRHIAETALRIRDLSTGDERWLAHPVQRDQQESRAKRDAYPGMSFTPDSREVVVYYGGRIWRVPVDGSDPIPVPFQADVKLPMGPEVDFDYPVQETPTFVAKQIRDARPSPDGSRLAFVVLGDTYVMDLPDGTPRRLSDLVAMESGITWSPDSRWVAFAAWDDADGGHLYRVRADGSGVPEQLTATSALYREPTWSPDGARIIAFRGPGRAYDEALQRGVPGGTEALIWVPATGGDLTVVTEAVDFSGAHFTSSADRIYATSFGDGLISMRWDGTDRKAHVRVTGGRVGNSTNPLQASGIWMAPVGDQALVQVVNQLYVVTVPMVGGDAPTISVANPENASFPARQLTDIGGQFPAWGPGGRTVHWSIGNAFFSYDLDDARAYEDSVAAVERAQEAAGADTAAAEEQEEQADEDAGYRPSEIRVRVTVARDRPEGRIVLRGARIVTMDGDQVIDRGDVVVVGTRITAVGATGSVAVPEGAQVVDVAGKTIVPGFVDTHAHLRAQVDLHRAQPWSYAANLAYGVTTARDPQTGTTDVLTYEDFVRAGLMLGPRIYSTGPGVFSSEQIGSLKEARTVLSRYSDYYDTKTIKMYGAGNREVRQWIIQAAREQGLMPTTEGSLDLALNMTMGQDGYSGMEHNMPGFPLYRDVVQLVARSKMAYTPTILVSYGGPWAENYYYATTDVFGDEKLRTFTPFEELQQKSLRRGGPPSPGGSAGWFHPLVHTFDRISAFARDVLRAGGRVGIGSHGQLQGLGFHWELWSMHSGGMTEHEALRVATIVGAESIGLDRDLGSIAAGKLADLVVLDANPLENIRNTNTVSLVMMNGRLYDADTLAELAPEPGPAPEFYWLKGVHPDVRAGIR